MAKVFDPIAGSVFLAMVICTAGVTVLLPGCAKKADPEPTPEVFAILSAVALDREFVKDEGLAQTKFKDRVVIVTGKVKKVTKAPKTGTITVELLGVYEKGMTPEQSVVECVFSESKSGEPASITVGSEITVRGTCEGRLDMWVTLESYSLEAIPPADKPVEKTTP